MSNIIRAEDGTEVYLDPRYSIKPSETSFFIYSSLNNDMYIIQKNFEDEIRVNCIKDLIAKGVVYKNKSNIFNDAELCEAIFNWDSSKEINGILSFLPNKTVDILDIGCGYGRILLPLHEMGLRLTGIDISQNLLLHVQSKLTNNNVTLLHSDISSIPTLKRFNLAYASMNTLRYIDSFSSFKKHFLSLSQCVVDGGVYMFQITIYPHINQTYYNKWNFTYKSKIYYIEWAKHSDCKLHNYIIDKVTISDSEKIYQTEYQKQLFFSYSAVIELLKNFEGLWKLEKTLDQNFNEIKLQDNSFGNIWFILKKI